MRHKRLLIGLLLFASAGRPLTWVMHVEPARASWSGWTEADQWVSEVLTLNVDSLAFPAYCELFTGAGGAEKYSLTVLTYPGGYPVASGESTAVRDHVWVPCSLVVTHPESLTKGRQYEFRWSREGGARILYYYHDSTSGTTARTAYEYGFMKAGGESLGMCDLAMRCHGLMNPADSTYWAAVPMTPNWWNEAGLRETWRRQADSAGLGAVRLEVRWNNVQRGSLDSFNFADVDSELALCGSANRGFFCLLNYCAESASSRIESTRVANTDGGYDWTYHKCVTCAPRGLYYPVDSDSNFWARFVGRTVRHLDSTGHSIHVYETFNETNDTCVVESLHRKGVTGWWRRPNLAYTTGFDSMRGLCSLYVRLCEVAATVIETIPGHQNDTILVGSMAEVEWSNPDYLVRGKEWLRTMYDIAGNNVFWGGVSFHAYQWPPSEFDPGYYQQNSDTVRTIMRDHGHLGPVWNTEIGWDTTAGEATNARNLCKTFVSSKASEALPQGGYDRVCWWLFRETQTRDPSRKAACGHYPMLDSAMATPYMPFYAFTQLTHTLTGKRYNGRTMTGDTALDNHVRAHEFEDSSGRRTWVAWLSPDAPTTGVELPARCDTLDTVALDYDGTPPASQKSAAQTGWLDMSLQQRPVFVIEREAASRPDLEVDSVYAHVQGEYLVVQAYVANKGGRATPRSPLGQPYPTWAVLTVNGDSLAQSSYTDTIGVNQRVDLQFAVGTQGLPDTMLLEVRINPAQTYVELNTDDNAGYLMKVLDQ